MIVNGFIEPFVKELPMEYAVELNRLIELEMEGSLASERQGSGVRGPGLRAGETAMSAEPTPNLSVALEHVEELSRGLGETGNDLALARAGA